MQIEDILGVGVIRRADFWWVVVDGKPCYPCSTKEEAIELVGIINANRKGTA